MLASLAGLNEPSAHPKGVYFPRCDWTYRNLSPAPVFVRMVPRYRSEVLT